MENFWKDKKVVITGDRGFIGKNLKKELTSKKATVTGYDLKNKQDICNQTQWNEFLSTTMPDIVFHLAALTQVTDAEEDVFTTYATNIGGTLNVVKGCHALNIPVIVASSDKVYGDTGFRWATEKTVLKGYSCGVYSATKCVMDELVQDLSMNGLQCVITRSANVYGLNDDNKKRLIPGLLAALKGESEFKLRTHGKQIRTYIHIKDAVGAYIATAEAFMNRRIPTGQIVNYTYGRVFSVKDVCKMAAESVGLESSHFFADNPVKDDNGEIAKQYIDSAVLGEIGYRCEYPMDMFWEEEVAEMLDKRTKK